MNSYMPPWKPHLIYGVGVLTLTLNEVVTYLPTYPPTCNRKVSAFRDFRPRDTTRVCEREVANFAGTTLFSNPSN